MPAIQPKEWRWALTWAIVILVVTSLPYLYAAMMSTPAQQFSGFVIGLEDGNSYLAKMQEGRSGYWLFRLAYTPEPQRGEFFFIYYILLGKLAGLLNLPNVLVFHLSKLAAIPLSLLAAYFFIAYFTAQIQVRRIALLLLGFSGGLGWLWLALGGPAELGRMPVDLWAPDASFFLAALTYPHLPLAQGILLVLAVATLDYLERGQQRSGFIAAACGVAVSLIHPYTLPIIGTVLGLYVLGQYARRGRLWPSVFRLLLITLPALPYLLYVLWVFYSNPAFIAWKEQSLTYSPEPIHYLLGFGFTLIFALTGLWLTRRQCDYKSQFLRFWILSVPVLLYLPLALQRRFLDGYQAPLVVLAALGLAGLLEQISQRRWRTSLLVITLLVMSLTNVLLLTGAVITASQRPDPIFVAGADVAAAHWLAGQTGPAVVLSAYQTGNYLPTVANVRAFVGHGPETANSAEKRRQAEIFFNRKTTAEWRRALLEKFDIRYVYYGPAEKAAGGLTPEDMSYLEEVYRNQEVQIFRVRLP